MTTTRIRTARATALSAIIVLALSGGCAATHSTAPLGLVGPPEAVLRDGGWQALPAAARVAPVERWRIQTPRFAISHDGSYLIAADAPWNANTTTVRRLDAATGKPAWSVPDVEGFDTSLYLSDGDDTSVADIGSNIAVLDPTGGRRVWRDTGYWTSVGRTGDLLVVTSGRNQQQDVFKPATVPAAGAEGQTVGIDWMTGAVRWHQPGGGYVNGRTVVRAQKMGPDDGHPGSYWGPWLVGVRDPASGAPRWQQTLPTGDGTVLIVGNTLVAATEDYVVGYDLATGAQRWRTPLGARYALGSSLSQIDTDTVLVHLPHGADLALHAATGAPAWRNPGGPVDYWRGFRAGGRPYLLATSTDDSQMEVRSVASGQPVGTGSTLATAPNAGYALAAGTAYRIADGSLVATALPELTERWRIPLHIPPGKVAAIAHATANGVIVQLSYPDDYMGPGMRTDELVGYFAPGPTQPETR